MSRDPRHRSFLGAVLVLLAAWPVWSGLPAASRASHRLVRAGDNALEFDLTFPRAILRAGEARSSTWTDATVPGCAPATAIGRPLLPEYVLTVAVPLGTRPRVDAAPALEEDLGSGLPPPLAFVEEGATTPTLRAALPAESRLAAEVPIARAEPVVVARHMRLARVLVRPVRYDPTAARWRGVRSLHVTVAFEPEAGKPSVATPSTADDADRALISSVANPWAGDRAMVLDPPEDGVAAVTTIVVNWIADARMGGVFG
jgi:hypothetical protein